MPSLDDVDLAKLTVRLTQDHREGKQMFRLMVFNVLAHNRDDHAKQFSFLMDRTGAWTLAPPYDLTFAPGIAGEHTTSVMGERKAPTAAHMHKVADAAGLARQVADRIVEQTREAFRRWPEIAAAGGVTDSTTAEIGRVIGAGAT